MKRNEDKHSEHIYVKLSLELEENEKEITAKNSQDILNSHQSEKVFDFYYIHRTSITFTQR